MALNWNRVREITMAEPGYTIAKAWVGPAVTPSLEQVAPAASEDPNIRVYYDDGLGDNP
jgi:hypothetical protein